MTEANKKTSSGIGKFFFGAALGAIAGAIAGRFISSKVDKDEDPEECECDGECEHCEKKDAKIDKLEKKVTVAKETPKKSKTSKVKAEKITEE